MYVVYSRVIEGISTSVKVEMDIAASITSSSQGGAVILVIMYNETFKTDVVIPPLPEGGGGYTVLPPSVRPSVCPRNFSSHFSQ